MIYLTPIVSRVKSKSYNKLKKKKEKLDLNLQLQTYNILTNNDQMLILLLSYFITTVFEEKGPKHKGKHF